MRKWKGLAPSDLPPPILASRFAVGGLSAYAGGFVNAEKRGRQGEEVVRGG